MRLRLAPFVLAAGLCLAGCPSSEENGRGRGRGGPGGQRGPAPVSVAVEPATVQTVRDTLVTHANLEPEALVAVMPRAAGEIQTLEVEAGDVVKKGQVVLTLDSTRADLAVREAKLALERARTSLARTEGLNTKGLATSEELEQARQAVDQALLAEERANLDKADTQVRSPIDGVITKRHVSVGATVTQTTALFDVADREPLLALAPIPEAEARSLSVGKAAWVTPEDYDRAIPGQVIRIAPIVDVESGTVVVTVAVRGAGPDISIKGYATVEIVVAEREGAVTVPQAALALRGDEDRVLVIEEGKGGAVVRQRTIRAGVRNAGRLEVLDGLKAGERVVVAAPDDLRDGAPVRVVDRSKPQPETEPPAQAPEKGPPKGTRRP